MKILFYGAGVIGSLYAARLQEAGHAVTVLARGTRHAAIVQHGIVLEHARTGARTATRLDVVQSLKPDDAYDIAVVTLRKTHVDAVLPVLGAATRIPIVLFMVNNPSGYRRWADAVGIERLLIGFPGAGGTVEDNIVKYVIVPRFLQPTTLGEPDRRLTARLRHVATEFRRAGFPVSVTRNIDAWQKSHVAWVSAVADALYMTGKDLARQASIPTPATDRLLAHL